MPVSMECSIRVSEQRDQNSELAVFNDGSSSNFDTGWTSPSGFPTSFVFFDGGRIPLILTIFPFSIEALHHAAILVSTSSMLVSPLDFN